ncbi:MAG: type I restriction enzyme HsdR N-terminal domain-containing protein [Nitrospirota bacterium]
MSTYIPLGKIPTSPEERRELLAKRVEMEEYLSHIELTQVQRRVIDFLISQKGYTNADIEANRDFRVDLPDASFNSRADIILKIDGKIFCVIRCVMSSLESWERHSIAFSRVVESYQIPYAIVTDSESARILDVVEGKLIAEGLDAMPSKEDAMKIVQQTAFSSYPQERAEKEKRILYAFDAIKCSTSLADSE